MCDRNCLRSIDSGGTCSTYPWSVVSITEAVLLSIVALMAASARTGTPWRSLASQQTFRFADDMNWHRLMWANDFPHSDSTWPWSQELLAEQTVQLTPEQTKAILSDNVADLYKIDTSQFAVVGGA